MLVIFTKSEFPTLSSNIIIIRYKAKRGGSKEMEKVNNKCERGGLGEMFLYYYREGNGSNLDVVTFMKYATKYEYMYSLSNKINVKKIANPVFIRLISEYPFKCPEKSKKSKLNS